MRIYSWIGLSLVFALQGVASDYGNWSDGSSYVQSTSTRPTIEDFIYEKINTTKIDNLPEMENGGLYVYAFNAGQSNAICLTKEGKSVMIDGGADTKSPLMRDNFITVLKNHLDKNPLQRIFITHPHKDHYNLFITKFSRKRRKKMMDL